MFGIAKLPQNGWFSGRVLLTIIACLMLVVVVIAIIQLLARHILRLRRNPAASSFLAVGGVAPKPGLDLSAIAALQSFVYRGTGDDEEAPAECAVCLSVVEDGEVVRVLTGCRHVFHVGCIDMWLRSHATCPLCRADAEPPEAGEASSPTKTFSIVVGYRL